MKLTARRSEDGFAMLTVLFAILILTMLGSLLLANAITALPQARHAQDFNAALGAAEAGIDDYLTRLAENYTYATDPWDSSNAALTTLAADGSVSHAGGYVPMAAASRSSFNYVVDTRLLGATGQFMLTVHGRVGKVTRTVKVGLRPYGFLDALSLTDYNIVDPAMFPIINNSVNDTTTTCMYHQWEDNLAGGKGPRSGCGGLLNYWIGGNILNGPMESNDDYYLCGNPQFLDTVDSGDPSATGPYWSSPACGSASPYFARAGDPSGQHQVKFPPSSALIKDETTPGDVNEGCLYTGPTAISITNVTMTVVSPYTRSTNVNCVGNGVPLPKNGVIYVQDIPSAPDANAGSCDFPLPWVGDGAACNQGDVFVQGTLAGALTIAADNNIIITGDLKYADVNATAPRQVLGLIATNSVEINHPVDADGSNTTGTVTFPGASPFSVPLKDPVVQAAILSLQHSFSVLNFDKGSTGPALLGAVKLTGSVAGKFMDTEGEFAGSSLIHGYDVNYTYDARLRNGGLTPPKFLQAEKTFWHRISFVDCGNGSSTSTSAAC